MLIKRGRKLAVTTSKGNERKLDFLVEIESATEDQHPLLAGASHCSERDGGQRGRGTAGAKGLRGRGFRRGRSSEAPPPRRAGHFRPAKQEPQAEGVSGAR